MKKIVFCLAIVSMIILASFWSREVSVHSDEFNALVTLIKKEGVSTPEHPDQSFRLEDNTYIFILTKDERKIQMIKKSTYRSETIVPIVLN